MGIMGHHCCDMCGRLRCLTACQQSGCKQSKKVQSYVWTADVRTRNPARLPSTISAFDRREELLHLQPSRHDNNHTTATTTTTTATATASIASTATAVARTRASNDNNTSTLTSTSSSTGSNNNNNSSGSTNFEWSLCGEGIEDMGSLSDSSVLTCWTKKMEDECSQELPSEQSSVCWFGSARLGFQLLLSFRKSPDRRWSFLCHPDSALESFVRLPGSFECQTRCDALVTKHRTAAGEVRDEIVD